MAGNYVLSIPGQKQKSLVYTGMGDKARKTQPRKREGYMGGIAELTFCIM